MGTMTDLGGAPVTLLAAAGAQPPLHLITLLTAWRLDVVTAVLVVVLAAGYHFGSRRLAAAGTPIEPSRRVSFYAGLAIWVLVSMAFIGVYQDELFWVRALQVVALIMIVPFALAAGAPITALRGLLGEHGRARVDRALATKLARIVTAPATTSLLILATPWVLYFTPWYPAVLDNAVVDVVTRLALVAIGFLYFYSRLQADPVPRKYPQMISIAITFTEVIVDATLGLALWLGPLKAADHYAALGRTWGPSMRTDQIVGAGIIWILGDLIGVPFLFALMRALTKDEQASAAAIDAELDAEEEDRERAQAGAEPGDPAPSRLWWENDPQLSERFRRG